MYSTPPMLFLLVWIFPLFAAGIIPSDLIYEVSEATQLLVTGNILTFFVIYILVSTRHSTSSVGSLDLSQSIAANLNNSGVAKRALWLFGIWLIIYAVNIVGSGGFPLLWVLTGDSRTYVDFGLPTLAGVGNLIRAFLLVICFYLIVIVNSKHQRKFKFIAVSLLASAFILETGRGNGIVLLLHPIGLYLLFYKVKLDVLMRLAAIAVAVLVIGGIIHGVRGGGDFYQQLAEFGGNTGISNTEDASLFELVVWPTVIYVAVPIINVDLNIINSPMFSFQPFYVFQNLVPSIFREYFFLAEDYGTLINDSNNVSTFYISMIRDFGIAGTFFFVSLIQIIVCFVYSAARNGSVVWCFTWPALFMATVLSFFAMYYTSLVVVLYPLLAAIFFRGLGSQKSTPKLQIKGFQRI
jgi:oligosaccharide repeat unit polymerase